VLTITARTTAATAGAVMEEAAVVMEAAVATDGMGSIC
jgi:hypothetical protein